MAHGPSCSTACGIFPDQGSNLCPLHWQADSYPLRHQGSPVSPFASEKNEVQRPQGSGLSQVTWAGRGRVGIHTTSKNSCSFLSTSVSQEGTVDILGWAVLSLGVGLPRHRRVYRNVPGLFLVGASITCPSPPKL